MHFHFYCPTCEHPLVKTTGKVAERNNVSTTCAVCGKEYSGQNLVSKGNFFVSLPLEKQFASILADDDVRNQLLQSLEHRTEPQNGMSDITDGAFYKDQRQRLHCKDQDLTLTMSADGSPVFKSSTYSIWPVHVVLNELPPYLRWSNMMTSLLWYGSKHPNMTLLLQAFAEQMKRLSADGITWNAGSVKYPMTVGMVNDDRDHPSMLEDMRTAAMTKRTVHGVKGPSPLLNVPGFDIVWSFRPDFMHCVLLGVVRQLSDLWFSDVGKEYYIGAPTTVAEVDCRLLSQKPHQCFNRPPRSVRVRKYWKAVEWESWLIYYSLPCLTGILPRQYLEHFALLASALYDLLKSVVSKQDVDRSTEKITRFVVMTQYLYGEAQVTSNVHTLLHIPKSVLLHGPLWALACNEFESNMGQLLKLVSSSKGVPYQIMSRIFLRSSFRQLQSMASEEVQELCSQMPKKRDDAVKLLGKAKAAPQDLSDLLQRNLGVVHSVEEFSRVRICGCTIHSEQYKSPLKRDSTAVKIGHDYTKVERILWASHGSPFKSEISNKSELSESEKRSATIAARRTPVAGQVAPLAAQLAPLTAQVALLAAQVAPLAAQVAPLAVQVAPLAAQGAPLAAQVVPFQTQVLPF
ncbi:hypothetical protein HPB47_018801 [Ixodes persulcatus]|uniref:Uncharacterized protein n=1 Tax=Ixodes persulcatus TaxID=34615 RepID=A0AC60QMD0_IXOPE|nr:hypothetical protein HPB47_018801 [Ixodes persulcatus]